MKITKIMKMKMKKKRMIIITELKNIKFKNEENKNKANNR